MEKKKTVVVALGHRALGNTLPEQKIATREAAKAIADLVETGANVVVSHGNSPQVGMIHMAMSEFAKNHPGYTSCPMSVCSAMSQGYIGYDLQNSIRAEFMTRGIYKPVSTVLTQVLVDPYDEAFYEPAKVIGRVLTEDEAREEEKKGNFVAKTPEGLRRIVASPKPQQIIELDTIKALLKDDEVVICCGGGGIPVMEQGVDLRGASAVIEKDLVCGLLAMELSADVLMILTSVDAVALNFKKDNEKILSRISVRQARSYCEENQFERGSMLPKFEAAINFVEMGGGKKAVITSIPRAKAAYMEKAGTVIVDEI
ncbi:MAG TPA: carbamate kinase [Lachnospiraceae bacterium]|nr:carbamate kinase [Lachnospiraceae bacterium]